MKISVKALTPNDAQVGMPPINARTLTDMGVCHIEQSGLFGTDYCLVPITQGCKHREPFFNRFLCFHPNRLKFAGKAEVK